MLTVHNIPLTAGITAELLYLADVEPNVTDEASALAAIDRALAAHHDNLTECTADVSAMLCGEWANPMRWSRCVLMASRLCGVSV